MINQIQSQLEIVSIHEVKKNYRQIKKEYFSEFELEEIGTKHLQTLAGFYATKMALKKIINQQKRKHQISEKQIILLHNSAGAPYIKEIESLNRQDIDKFFISISHTSENVYGFASIGESAK